jgi:para-nitrobenzyl esterase
LSSKIVDYWTNFAKYGNPNGSGEEVWTPYSAEHPEFMLFDADENNSKCKMTGTPEFKGPSPRK